MKEILRIKDLTKSYSKKKKKIIVLKNINYEFSTNKLYYIKGKSGVGKTTLIEIIGLLKNFDNGKIFIDNQDITNLSSKEKSNIRNRKLGFIFQSFYLMPTMTALENVMLPMYLDKSKTKKEITENAKKVLKEMGLENRCNHYPKELSGGEQQRVAIARALVNNPNIILADEPTGALDPENEEKVLKILKDLTKKGKCIIVVSHNEKTSEFADEVIEIKNGRLIKCIE